MHHELPPDTQVRLEREANALVKRVLSQMEELGELAPTVAFDPVEYNQRRKQVTRAIWGFVRLAVQAGAELVVDYRCPHCGEERTRVSRGL